LFSAFVVIGRRLRMAGSITVERYGLPMMEAVTIRWFDSF